MYLESLCLKNVRLLADQEFRFTRGDSPRMWTVFVGDNGLCKSTILQSIALLVSGPALATALAPDAQRFVNAAAQEKVTFVEGVLRPPSSREAWESVSWPVAREAGQRGDYRHLALRLLVSPGAHGFSIYSGGKVDRMPPAENAQIIDEVRRYRASGWLAVGYGVGRFLPQPGEVAIPANPVIDRVEGLFDVRHKMLGADFYKALVAKDKSLGREFARVLRDIFLMETDEHESLLPGLANLVLKGRKGVTHLAALLEEGRFELTMNGHTLNLPATSLSDGYQSIIAWISDLLGHAFLDRGTPIEPADLSGIVLLDEIDLHLHPTWQRRIVPVLKRVFPKLQFIVTTHSPLVLAGFDRDEIIRLRLEGGAVVQDEAPVEPGILTASELLTDFFDVSRAGRPDLVELERRYAELKGYDRLTRAQRQELHRIEETLSPYWTATPSEPITDH